jgi:hypothetical protein
MLCSDLLCLCIYVVRCCLSHVVLLVCSVVLLLLCAACASLRAATEGKGKARGRSRIFGLKPRNLKK